jgi:hypothetical protein
MKRAAILSITTFYLLLTTGMFVCILSCVTESLTAKTAMHHCASMAMGKNSTPDKNGKKDDCCKKHGNFSIKENLKPATELQFNQLATVLPALCTGYLLSAGSISGNIHLAYNKAPPRLYGKCLIIQNCSFLI